MRGFLRGAGAVVLVAACVGCGGPDDEDPPAPAGPVQVTLKVSSFTRNVGVGWHVEGQPVPDPNTQLVSPPWSKSMPAERGARVFLAAGNAIAACEILIDGKSVVKQHSTRSGEGARCEYVVA